MNSTDDCWMPPHDLLTLRERAVLALIVSGHSSKEADRVLDVSRRTIEFHRANIMQKLRAKNTADLVRIVLGEYSETDLLSGKLK